MKDFQPDVYYVLRFADIQGFWKGIKDLDPQLLAVLDLALREILAVKGLDLIHTDWLKKVATGVWELRVGQTTSAVYSRAGHDKPPEAIHQKLLIRVFVSFVDDRLVVLLNAYNKGRDPSALRQAREINKAKKILSQWKLENLD